MGEELCAGVDFDTHLHVTTRRFLMSHGPLKVSDLAGRGRSRDAQARTGSVTILDRKTSIGP